MKLNESNWEPVGNAGFSAGTSNYTSIAINSSGTPYVAYRDGGNSGKASVMKYNGSSWELVGNAGFSDGVVLYTTMVIDGSGTPYVAYSDGGNSDKATVMKFNGTSWESVGNAGFSAAEVYSISLAIDGSGTPYVSLTDAGNSSYATVMKFNGTSWELVGNAGFSAGAATNTSIAIDGSGTPYVVYTDYANSYKTTVMKFNGTSWENLGNAGFSAGAAWYVSQALNGSGKLYVVYRDGGNFDKATVMSFQPPSCTDPTSGGTIAADQASCTGFNPTEITSSTAASGETGTLEYKWQLSTTGSSSGFSDISPTVTSTTYNPPAITASTWYKRLARVDCMSDWSGAAESNVVEMTVYATFSPGAILTTGETMCYNGNPGVIGNSTLASGGDESISYQWQLSTTNSSSGYGDISSVTSTTYDPPSGLTATTWYRRMAKDGTCSTTFTASTGTWEVTVYDEFIPGAILTTGESICYNGDPAEIGNSTVASGGDETITYQWQYSTDNFSTVTSTITSSNAATYDPPSGLTVSTWYRRQAVDGNCNTTFETSAGVWKVTVHNDFTPGTISSTGETICYDGDPGEIGSATAASGGDGSITYQWQLSTDDFSTVTSTISSSDAATYNPPSGLTTTTWYRRQAKDATCNTTFETSTGTWKVTVRNEFTPGVILTTGETICYNGNPGVIGNSTLASGGDESITYKWESSTDDFATSGSVISGATSSTYDPANLTTTTWYRRYAKDGLCNTTFEVSTGTWMVTVYSNFVVGSISEDQYNCSGDSPNELTGVTPTGGNTPYTYQWQESTTSTTSGFTDIKGATSLDYQPGALTATTYYRLNQTSASSCGTLTTNTVTISVTNLCCSAGINYCQKPAPVNNTAFVSDIASGYKIYDNFSGIVGAITDIEWWGSTVVGDNYCSENPKSFVISFYRDNGGTVGELIETYSVSATGTATGSTFGDNDIPIMVYSYALTKPFYVLSEGWLSIQGNPSSSCEFTWITSPNGDGKSFVDGRSQLTDDFAFGLTADPDIPVSDWALYLGLLLIGSFIVIKFGRRMI